MYVKQHYGGWLHDNMDIWKINKTLGLLEDRRKGFVWCMYWNLQV